MSCYVSSYACIPSAAGVRRLQRQASYQTGAAREGVARVAGGNMMTI